MIGNIKEQSFENIMNSIKANQAYEKIKKCKRNCAFIVTERHDMVRRPFLPIKWILNNRLIAKKGKSINFD